MHDSPDPDAPLPSPDPFPSAAPSSADRTALGPDTRSPGASAGDLATEVSGDGVFPGERATSARSFTACLADIASELPAFSWKTLFLQTSGHLIAGRAVLTGADAMGQDLSTVEAGHFSDLIASEVLSRIRRQAPDSPELRLAHLLTFMRTINSDTIGIAAGAMISLGSLDSPPEDSDAGASDAEGSGSESADAEDSEFEDPEFEVSDPLDTADLTTHLVEDGLLLPALDRTGHYTIPPVLRTILRRLYDATDRHSESRSRRALGATSAEWLRAPAAYHLDGFDEALRQVADAGDWSALTELWSHRGHALMFDHFDSTIEAFSKVPEAQAHKSAVLAEALGDCLQAADIGRQLNLSDPVTVLNKVNFEHAGVPTLSSQMDRIDDGDVTVDDILIMAIASMRRHRVLGQAEQGRETAQSAQELLHGRHNFQTAPSRLCEARFHLELGINTMFIGDIAGSVQLLRRSIIITELATASSPYLLQPANAYSALAHAMLGNGPSSDVHLRHFDELMDRTRFSSPHALSAYTLARMIRAMDALDLEAANEFSMRLDDPALGHHSWIGVALHRSLLGILRGDVGIEDKRLQQIIDTNRSTLPDGGILRDSLRISLVCLHLAQGQTHLAQNVLFDADSESVYIILSRANLHLTIGEYGTAAHLANRVLSQKTLDLHAKASARAVQAASLLGKGDDDEADSAFVDALEYCRITASLVPVALVPKSLRDRLIQRSSAIAQWDLIAPVFADAIPSHAQPGGSYKPSGSHDLGGLHDQRSGERLRHRLLAIGETLRTRADHTLLSPSQRQLLALLDTQSSVSAIAAELSLVEGTVKNKLSNLYASLGVRNRRDALARGYEYGYLPLER